MTNSITKIFFIIIVLFFCFFTLPLPELRDIIANHITYKLIFLKNNMILRWISGIYETYHLSHVFTFLFILSGLYIFRDNFSSLAKFINKRPEFVGKITLLFLICLFNLISLTTIGMNLLLHSKSLNHYIEKTSFSQGTVNFFTQNESLWGALGIFVFSSLLFVLLIKQSYTDTRGTNRREKSHSQYAMCDESPMPVSDNGMPEDEACLQSAESLVQEKNFEMAAHEYLHCGRTREAAQLFIRSQNYFNAAEIYRDEGDFKEAGNSYRKAGKYILAAECYEKAGNSSMAASMYKKGEYYFKSGMLYLSLGQPKKAEDCFNLLLENSEETMNAFEGLGDYYAREKKWNEAIRNYQRILIDKEVNSYNINIWYKLARAVEVESDDSEAGTDFAIEIYDKILTANYLYKDVKKRLEKYKSLKSINHQHDNGTAIVREKAEKRYKIVKEIGRGGMGVVYQAQDLLLDRPIAYKILLSNGSDKEDAVREFKREAKSVATLNHTNIVAIYDFGKENSNYFIVMEYIDGFNLRDICRDNPNFIFPSFKRIFTQIFDGLSYAHKKNIIHRDIKPLNIMLNRDGVVKIMDFGLAKFMEEENAGQSLIKGTPHYISPEQVLGMGVDHRTDIYALGITMYFLLAGNRYPFEKGNVLYHNVHTMPPSLKQKKPGINQKLNDIVMKCLEKNKERRYQKVSDLKKDVEELPFIIS